MIFFTHLANWLFSAVQPAKPVYTTIVYPVQGKAVVLHDGLGIRHESPWYQLSESLLRQDDIPTLFDSMQGDSSVWSNPGTHINAGDFATDFMAANCVDAVDTHGVNPANGLPMLNGCVDVMGNPIGTDMLSDSWASDFGLDDFSSISDFEFG